jgi:phosphoribosylformylglycinamidine synthase
VRGSVFPLQDLFEAWSEPLERIFPSRIKQETVPPIRVSPVRSDAPKAKSRLAVPRVLITAFPGTNCEYDTEKAFLDAGGKVDTLVFRNLRPEDIGESLRELREKINQSQIIAIPGGFSAGDEPDGSGKFIYAVFRNPEIQDAVEDFLRNRDGLMLGICNGFQALVKLGLVLFGENRPLAENSPTLTFNSVGRHVSRMVRTKVVSNGSPWFHHLQVGDIHTIPVSHGEGRFVASREMFEQLAAGGQIATQYVDQEGNASGDFLYNPNGSMHAVEGLTSPDGRILGKMAHSERMGDQVSKNVPGEKNQGIFKAGIEYFS